MTKLMAALVLALLVLVGCGGDNHESLAGDTQKSLPSDTHKSLPSDTHKSLPSDTHKSLPSDTHESLSGEVIAYFNELGPILDGVTDVDSAKAAALKLDAWLKNVEALTQRWLLIGKPKPAEARDIDERHRGKLSGVWTKFLAFRGKLQNNPELQKILQEPIEKIYRGIVGEVLSDNDTYQYTP